MTIELSSKDIKDVKRLGSALTSGIVPVNDVKKFLEGIVRQIDQPAAASTRKVNGAKLTRKEKYRNKLFAS